MHKLRFTGGQVASRTSYKDEERARVASRRIARRDGCTVEVWWCDDTGTPKVVVFRTSVTKKD